jgi:hypothetical protein
VELAYNKTHNHIKTPWERGERGERLRVKSPIRDGLEVGFITWVKMGLWLM